MRKLSKLVMTLVLAALVFAPGAVIQHPPGEAAGSGAIAGDPVHI